MPTQFINPESKTCDWSVQGIKNLCPEGLNELCGCVMDMNPDKEFTKGFNYTLSQCIAHQEEFDVEHNAKVIQTIYEEYSKLFEHVRQEARTGGVVGDDLDDEEKDMLTTIIQHGLPREMVFLHFSEMITMNWYARKRYIQWFHKKMAEEDLTAPVEIYNSQFGKGLRATRDIKKGELVCYYPMDWVSDPSLCPEREDGRDAEIEKWMCLQNAGVLGYGNPHDQDSAQKIMDKLVENSGRITRDLNDYGFSFGSTVDGICHIWGDREGENHKKNNWFIGHMINDGVYHIDQTKEGYEAESKKVFAAAWNGDTLEDSIVNVRLNSRMTAIKDIKKGEPIHTIYGSEYWFSGGHTPEGESDHLHETFCRHRYNTMSTGQKKKAKKKIKDITTTQRQTFKDFRERTAANSMEQHEEIKSPPHPYQIVVTEVNPMEGRLHVASTICCPEGWEPHHPTQFADFYPDAIW